MESIPTDEKDRPDTPISIEEVVVFKDPYEEWKEKREKEKKRERDSVEAEEAAKKVCILPKFERSARI
jgi:hypothetical protein